jgi:hypothetical protein
LSPRLTGIIALVAVCATCQAPASARGATVGTTESGPNGVTLLFSLGEFDTTHVGADGAVYTVLEAPGLVLSGEEGAPALPVKAALLTAPQGARVTVTIISEETDWIDGAVPAPWPKESVVDDGRLVHAVAKLEADPRYYATGAAYPSSAVEVRETGTLRGHRIVSVLFWPFQFVPNRGGVEVRRRIEARVEFAGGERVQPAPLRSGDRRWEPLLRDVLLNYESGKSWRLAPHAVGAQDRAMGEAAPEFKLRVTETGLYSVGFEDLLLAGFPSDVDVEWLRLYEKSYDPDPGRQTTVKTDVPILVRDSDSDGVFGPGDSIVFYGLSYWNRFPDRFGRGAKVRPHVYWLSWDESGGSRMETAPAWGEFENPEVPISFPETLHFEEDKMLNRAPVDPEVYLFWLPYSASDEVLPMQIPSPDPDMPYGVRMMLQPGAPGDHLLSLYAQNAGGGIDTVVVRKRFYSRSNAPDDKPPYLFNSGLTRPAGFLSSGANTLRMVGERISNSQIFPGLMAYLDWFEVSYYRKYLAWNDSLTCSAGGTGRAQQVEVNGFTSSDIHALDVTDRLHPLALDIGPQNVVPAGDGTYKLVVRGEFPQRHIIAAAASDGLKSLGADMIERDQPSDLRATGAGSDYLVIVHDDLAGEVEPLVELRRAQGFVVAVAKVSDVYDEFGDGHRSTEAIKNYLTYAYNNWGSAYALLVGDANEDMENVLKGPLGTPSPPDLVPSPLIRQDGVAQAPMGPQLVNSDAWYGVWLDGDKRDWIPDMFVGRLPAGSAHEADEIVSKIVGYEDLSGQDQWRSRGLFVADDNYSFPLFANSNEYCASPSEAIYFEPVSERAAAALEDSESGVPGFDAPVFKLGDYLWNVPKYPKSTCYPGFTVNDIQDTTRARVTPILLDKMSMGCLFVNYQGHGNEQVWTHESLFASFKRFQGLDDVPKLGNTHRPFVLFAYSCHVANFDDYTEGDNGDCMAERMVLLPDAGAVAAFASTGYEYVSTATFNEPIMRAFLVEPPVEQQSGEVYIRLGPALAKGEAVYWASSGSNRSALQTYAFLGDPAMRVDTAPPRIFASLGDTVFVDGDKLESREGEDSFPLHFEIRDEVAVDSSSVFLREVWHRVEGQDSTYTVPSSLYEVSQGRQGRQYGLDYTLHLLPASMELIAGAVDRNGRPSTLTLRAVLSVGWGADGTPISSGDIIGSSAAFRVRVVSPVPVPGEALSVAIDGVRESSFVRHQDDVIGRQWELSGESHRLEDGAHTLSLLVDGRVAESISVRVDTRFRFSSIIPYPSPFGDEGTTFFYELTTTGEVNLSEVVVKIFSVSGRLVAELRDESPAVGRGSIHWDGTDKYGEAVANGVYICKAVAADSRGKKATIMSKVALAR